MKILILILTILLLVSCEKETVTPSKTSNLRSCSAVQADKTKAAADFKYAQSNLAQPTQTRRDYWINKCDEARKKMYALDKEQCI